MKIIRCLAALMALAFCSPPAFGQIVTLPQVNNAGGAKVASSAAVATDSNGVEKGTATNPTIMAASAIAASTPCIVSATTSAATPTGCTATGSAGTYVVGPFTPQAGYAVRLVATGTWAGSIAVGTSANSCATVNALTVAGQAWGTYTGNANEAVDVPPTTGGITYCASITVTSGTLSLALRQ